MSGIVGIVNFDGKPVERTILDELTSSLTFRGPDRQDIWLNNNVGFGHTLLSTTYEAKQEKQPMTLDNTFWLVCDARIDGREELKDKLQAKGCHIINSATDPELILHAYKTWNHTCVQYLIGDFSFVIWDKKQKTLFCARDHFGVKPFFYALSGNTLIFSNSFDCVTKHPNISTELNDQAIADFLLFGFNLDLSSTSFKNIHRLPPAHTISWKSKDATPECYWTLPEKEQTRYHHKDEYIEHFKELLQVAVADRLRTNHVAIAMSGGLDSTLIAKIASDIFSETGNPSGLHAFTGVYDQIIPDNERHFSKLAADAIGIPIKHISGDSYGLFQGLDQYKILTPDPLDNPYIALALDTGIEISGYSRVCLNGQGADEILVNDGLFDLLGKVPLRHLLTDAFFSIFLYQKRPGMGLRNWIKKLNIFNVNDPTPPFPGWINPDIIINLDLKARWKDFWNSKASQDIGLRPTAYRRLSPENYWSPYLEGADPGITGIPVESRWPFLDIRMITDLLSFPVMPWFIDKFLIREAMTGLLPETIRLRPKTPLAGHVHLNHLHEQKMILSEKKFNQNFNNELIRKFISNKTIKKIYFCKIDITDPNESWLLLLPIMLSNWLKLAHLKVILTHSSRRVIHEKSFQNRK